MSTAHFGARSNALDVVQGIHLPGRQAIVTGGASGLGLETSRALAATGARVTLAVHPGGIMTGLQKFLPKEEMAAMGWLKPDGTPLDLFKTPAQGAATSVWAATAPEMAGCGGLYLEDCGIGVP